MIREFLDKGVSKIDGLALRERVMIFAAVAMLLVFLIETLLFAPLFVRHKNLALQVTQQQEKAQAIQSQFERLVQARKDDAASPLHDRIRQLQQRVAEGEIYLKNRRDKLVPPEKMGELLGQVLSKNGRLQLVMLETLPTTPLREASADMPDGGTVTIKSGGQERQVYKHGVKIILRGSYADLLQYLEAIEKLKTQMLWGRVEMDAAQYPAVELTLTLYTLSLDTKWLQV